MKNLIITRESRCFQEWKIPSIRESAMTKEENKGSVATTKQCINTKTKNKTTNGKKDKLHKGFKNGISIIEKNSVRGIKKEATKRAQRK